MVENLLEVRQHERRDAAIGFFTLLVVMAGHAILETARDTLFLRRLPATSLPWAYLAMAVLALGVAELNQALLERFSRRRVLSITLVVGAAITLSFWHLSSLAGHAATLVAFYVWTGLFATVVVVQFWLLVGDVLDVGQAKRMFALIGAGGLLGATFGSLAASGLISMARPQALVVAGSVAFLLAAALPFGFSRVRPPQAPRIRRELPSRDAADERSMYRGRLLVLVLLATVLVTIVDYTFKAVVAAQVPRAELGSFFGRYYALLSGIALLVQVVIAPQLIRSFGVSRTLIVVPLLLLATSLGFVVAGGLVAVLLLRAADGSMRHSLSRTTTEILYLPLGRSRERFKAYVEAVAQRGGQALASLVILVAVGFGVGPKGFAWALVVLAAVWLACTLGLEQQYLDLFKRLLRQGTIETEVDVPELDLRSLEALVSALSSEDDAEVVAALDLFVAYGKVHLIPALILFHPSRNVVLHAFEIFEGSDRTDLTPLAARLLQHPDQEVRVAALRHYATNGGAAQVLDTCASRPDPALRATAIVAKVATGSVTSEEGRDILDRLLDEGPQARLGLAQSLRMLPDEFAWVAGRLVRDADPETTVAVARSLAGRPAPVHIPVLIELLGDRDARGSAREALVQLGTPALQALERALMDERLPRSLRRHLPRSISRFRTQRAFEILEQALLSESDAAVEFKILRGLSRMVTENPTLEVDTRRLTDLAERWTRDAVLALYWRLVVDTTRKRVRRADTRVAELLSELLKDHESNAVARVFRLLHITQPDDEFRMIYDGLRSTEPTTRASSRELLAHLAPAAFRAALLALVDDASDSERLKTAATVYDPAGRTAFVALEQQRAAALAANDEAAVREAERGLLAQYAECLRAMLSERSGILRSVVSYHVGELGLGQLRDDLVAAKRRGGALPSLTERAMGLLDASLQELQNAH